MMKISSFNMKSFATLADKVLDRVMTFNICLSFWLNILIAEIFTFAVVSIMSIHFYGRVRPDYVITGAVTALLVSLVVLSAMLFIFKKLMATTEKFAESNAMLETLINTIPDQVFFKDTEGRIRIVNRTTEEYLDHSKEELIGKTNSDIMPPDSAEMCDRSDAEPLAQRRPIRGEEHMFVKGKGIRYLDVIKTPVYDSEGNVSGLLGVARDITEMKNSEDAAIKSERRFHAIFDAAPIGVAIVNTDRQFMYCNVSFQKMLGYSMEELSHMTVSEVSYPEDDERNLQFYPSMMTGATSNFTMEKRYTHKDGSVVWGNLTAGVVKEGNETLFIYALVEDITKSKQIQDTLKESEERYRMLFNAGNDAIGVHRIGKDGKPDRFIEINDISCQKLGYTREELLSLSPLDIDDPECHLDIEAIGVQLKENKHASFESVHITKGGKKIPVEINATLFNYLGVPTVLSIARDISERKKVEAQIQRSLREKEILLREIHHRVKNNLAVISSLLRLQAVGANNESLSEALEESQQRIKSMALVHEHLYQAKDFSCINYKDFIAEIVKQLESIYHKSNRPIVTKLNLEDLTLDIDSAIPCSLIINELITNAYKYAFPDSRSGKLIISFAKKDDAYILAVKDNGIGLPEGFDYRKSTTLGLQIVNVLCKQLRGTLQMRSDGGTEAVITFKPVANQYGKEKSTYS